MSGPVTVEAPANIAFIKYWGARDLEHAVPLNRSLSMTLSACVSRTTVQLLAPGEAGKDEVWIATQDGTVPAAGRFRERVLAHLGTLRAWAGRRDAMRVITRNSFPAAAGMASSASGFAALTLAVVGAFGRQPEIDELSDLARRSGSGSAARSVMGGYVEWPAGDVARLATTDSRLYAAVALAPASHWDLRDVVALVQEGPKEVSSLEGHIRAPTSPHFAARQRLLPERLGEVRAAILARDLERLGPLIERDAIELHLVAMSSVPPVFYWAPTTLAVLERVRGLRAEGVGAWMTMDAGANVHVICEPGDEPAVAEAVGAVAGVHGLVRDRVGDGPRTLDEHLTVHPAPGGAA